MFHVSVLPAGGVKLMLRHPLVVSAVTAMADPVTVPFVKGVGVVFKRTAVEAAFAPFVISPVHTFHCSLLVTVV